jgi:hypothetical protein
MHNHSFRFKRRWLYKTVLGRFSESLIEKLLYSETFDAGNPPFK